MEAITTKIIVIALTLTIVPCQQTKQIALIIITVQITTNQTVLIIITALITKLIVVIMEIVLIILQTVR